MRLLFSLLLLVLTSTATAGPLRDWLQQHTAQDAQMEEDGGRSAASLPAGASVLRDVAYGNDPRQRMDVYLPAQAGQAPVIVMVHGGGWRRGDKGAATVVDHKVARWLPRGFVFISVNYRLLPDTTPAQQAEDVAHALAFAQQHAAGWDADPQQFVLMGHSAGAHLVGLLSANPAPVMAAGGRPWLGTVVLDSAAVDVEAVMQRRHLGLYDHAFGDDPATWRALSPLQQLRSDAVPQLLVCSTQRRDQPCAQAETLLAKAKDMKRRAEMLPEPLSHRHINEDLGLDNDYTRAVENFMASLAPALQQRLPSPH